MSTMMGSRRRARELALQVLFQLDVQGAALSADQALGLFWRNFGQHEDDEAEVDEASRAYCDRLVHGVRSNLGELDALIGRSSRNWRLERMARVDRNLLRLAAYELKYEADVPAKVAINEAIEIAKRFGTSESPAFVNGILDRCLEEVRGR